VIQSDLRKLTTRAPIAAGLEEADLVVQRTREILEASLIHDAPLSRPLGEMFPGVLKGGDRFRLHHEMLGQCWSMPQTSECATSEAK